MFVTIEAHEYHKYPTLMDRMFKLRKEVFSDQLGWDVSVDDDYERDIYDQKMPAYLVWCDDDRKELYGSMRLMPTTGPTLLYDVFRRTFPNESLPVCPRGLGRHPYVYRPGSHQCGLPYDRSRSCLQPALSGIVRMCA